MPWWKTSTNLVRANWSLPGTSAGLVPFSSASGPNDSAIATAAMELLRRSTSQLNTQGSPRDIVSHKVQVNGQSLHYEQCGMGRHKVLLLPGLLGSTRRDFGPQLENLNKDMFTMYSIDPQGCGGSIPPKRQWTKNYHKMDATNAAIVMKNLGATKYSVVGINDGGVSAILLAALFPERVKKLITVGTGAKVTPQDRYVYTKLSDISSWTLRNRNEIEKMYDPEYLSSFLSEWLKTHDNIMEEREGDLCEKECDSVECDSLIIHGEEDPIVNITHAHSLHKLLKKSRLHLFSTGKHFVQLRHAREFNSLLESFLIE